MDRFLTVRALAKIIKEVGFDTLHIHHTWSPDISDFDGTNHKSLQDGMRNYHINENGWTDIAQHVTLFPDGIFMTGRSFYDSPASATGYNNDGNVLMIEMVGNFDVGNDTIEGEQLGSIVDISRLFDESRVLFHREMNPTKTCPGTSIDKEDFLELLKPMEFDEIVSVISDNSASEWMKYDDFAEALARSGDVGVANMGEYLPELLQKAFYFIC